MGSDLFCNFRSNCFKRHKLYKEISENTEKLIEKEIEARNFEYVNEDEITKNQVELLANETGYLEIIGFDKLKSLIEEEDVVLTIASSIGDFVMKGSTIAYLSRDVFDYETIEKIQKQFTFTQKRIAEEDYKEGIRKISEIAVRALSPGINDPNTAIHCIRKICILLSELAKVDGHYHYIETDGMARIYYTSKTFKETLVEHLYPILNYGESDAAVLRSIFQGLLLIKVGATPTNKKIINEMSEDIYKNAAQNFHREMDLELFMDVYQEIITGSKEENEIEYEMIIKND